MLIFGDISRSEKAIKDTWYDLCEALKNREFLYYETEKAKLHTFLKVFNDLFYENNGMQYLTVNVHSIKNSLMRGTKLSANEVLNYERFLPKKEFIKSSNRFSPAGVEWLYLALETHILAVDTIKREIRVQTNERFGYCNFELNKDYSNSKIVDLTIADDYDYENLNYEFNNGLRRSADKKVKNILCGKNTIVKGKSLFGIKEKNMVVKWAVFTYCKLLSEQIFIPIKINDAELEYAPFHTIAQYFISLGYSGIIYKSTVSNGGKNLVLFDKTMAKPFGEIKEEIIQ